VTSEENMTDELVAIHVRFANDGTVAEISERPSPLSPQQWFNALSEAAPVDAYRALAGGRGIFRITRAQIESVRAAAGAVAAA
jgi:hypothetical protein